MKEPYQEVAYFCYELDAYEYFVKLSERHWIEDSEKYESSLHSENESLWMRFDYRRDLSANLSLKYPQLQRQSYLITLLSIFEDFLNQLCVGLKQKYDLKICFTDFSGSGLERAKKYLTKVTPLNFPAQSKEWGRIKKAQSIRNLIAHAAGHIDLEKHKDQLKIVTENDDLVYKVYARNHLELKEGFILQVISDMKEFSKKLLSSCKDLPSNLDVSLAETKN